MEVQCLFCEAVNAEDAYYCSNCERSLIVGKLTSLGTGILTKGFVWELRPTNHTMGRNIGNDFVIPSNLIAANQLKINFEKNGFTIEDVGGRSNVLIDGKEVTGPTRLHDGCRLQVGVEEFTYTFSMPTNEKVTKVPDPLAAQLQLMLGIISEFHASLNLQEVLDNAVDAVLRLTRTRRGYCFLVETTTEGATELREVAARQSGGKPLQTEDSDEYTISQSIVSQVLSGNGSVIVEDAMAQQVNTDTIRKFKLKSIVCLPLMTFNQKTGQKHVMGIIYADSVMPTGELPKHCKSTLQMLTEIITSTIVKWRNYDQMESLFNDFQRNIGTLETDLQAVVGQIDYLQEKLAEPQQLNRIRSDEVNMELNSVESRIQAIYTNLRRLQSSAN